MKISDTRLKNFRKALAQRGLRLTDIADLMAKAPAQVSAFGGKNPTKGIGHQIAREIENALELEIGSLDIPEGHVGLSSRTYENQNAKLPLLNTKEAYLWCTSPQLDINEQWPNSLTAPRTVGDGSFVFLVESGSMEPKFYSGDKIVIDPTAAVHPNNFVAAFNTVTKNFLFRQLQKEGDDFYFCSLNPDWPDRIIEVTVSWTIYGRATWRLSEL